METASKTSGSNDLVPFRKAATRACGFMSPVFSTVIFADNQWYFFLNCREKPSFFFPQFKTIKKDIFRDGCKNLSGKTFPRPYETMSGLPMSERREKFYFSRRFWSSGELIFYFCSVLKQNFQTITNQFRCCCLHHQFLNPN